MIIEISEEKSTDRTLPGSIAECLIVTENFQEKLKYAIKSGEEVYWDDDLGQRVPCFNADKALEKVNDLLFKEVIGGLHNFKLV